MPQSIFQKLRVITLGNVHELLDAVIDWSDVASLKQYARDLATAKAQMEHFDNTLLGSISTLQRDIRHAEGLASTYQESIDILLTDKDPDNDHKALPIQVDLDELNRNLTADREKSAQKQADHEKASLAISQMEATLNKALARIEELEEQKEETESLKQGAGAMDTMREVMGSAAQLDNVGKRIEEKNATARAQFDRAMARAGEAAHNDTNLSLAEAALAKRKAELEKQTGPSGAAAAGAATEYKVTVEPNS